MKKDLKDLIHIVPNKNYDSIWIKLNKEKFEEKEDIFLGTYYISPPNLNNQNFDFFSSLNEEVNHFQKQGIYSSYTR